MKIKNEGKGKVFYGMHFYPGVAQYDEPGPNNTVLSQTVFLNEDTLRAMDPTFEGCPIYVDHVDDVDEDVDVVRNEADGWVEESFFNKADGKHWVKFILVSKRALRAVELGYRLSNAYKKTAAGAGGVWNGVTFHEQIENGVYEHLALVRTPRYDESVVMTPEQFKQYNEKLEAGLTAVRNSLTGEDQMFEFLTNSKVELKGIDENTMVLLPKTKAKMNLSKMINDFDARALKIKNGEPMDADGASMVTIHDGTKMSVNDLINAFKEKWNAYEDLNERHNAIMKKVNEEGGTSEEPVEELEDDKNNAGDNVGDDGKPKETKENEEDKTQKELEGGDNTPAKKENAAKILVLKNQIAALEGKKINVKFTAAELKFMNAKSDELLNAGPNNQPIGDNHSAPKVELMSDKVKRGQELLGSPKA